jgi:hypothetical protein
MTTELRARPGRVASRHPADGNNGDDDGAVQNLNGELAKWQVLESIAECQGEMWLNWELAGDPEPVGNREPGKHL